MRILVLSTILLTSSLALALSTLKSQMHQNTLEIKSLFYTNYAPAQWKAQHAGWSLDTEIQKLQTRIDSDEFQSIKQYHAGVRDFFNSTVDYHVTVQFLSTEAAGLPLVIKSAEGRYFLAFIDRRFLPENVFPFQEGDEVLSFGGQSTADAVAALQEEISKGNEKTNHALATMFLTGRSAANGNTVPQGEVELVIKTKNSEQIRQVTLPWMYREESSALLTDNVSPLEDELFNPLANLRMGLLAAADFTAGLSMGNFPQIEPQSKRLFADGHFDQQMSVSFASNHVLQTENGEELAENLYNIGGQKSYVPALGELIAEEASGFFHARAFKLASGKTIGMIRIPSYMPQNNTQVGEFVQKIQFMQQNTDALVIDQVNNPGGSVGFLYSLVQTLISEEAPVPMHRMAITQTDVFNAESAVAQLSQVQTEFQAIQALGPQFGGYPTSLRTVKNFVNTLNEQVASWKEGKRLTKPQVILGVDAITPHAQVQYTKPILVLTNELDFSGGDFFPAILQDNNRAKIMGVRTAGAGGVLKQIQIPNLLGIQSMQFTGSLAERANQQPLENLGVTPDISYELTANDLQNGHSDYKAAIIKAVEGML